MATVREREYEDWMNRKWRPATAVTYIVICIFDFLVAPLLTFVFYNSHATSTYAQWVPLTLQGSGLFHMAMGAIIGITAWQRGNEKIAKYQNEEPMASNYRYDEQSPMRYQNDDATDNK